MKVTDVSLGGGPAVSSMNTRASGKVRGAIGPGSSDAIGALRPPHAKQTAHSVIASQVAAWRGCRDIAKAT
jgi:hypothetical protein